MKLSVVFKASLLALAVGLSLAAWTIGFAGDGPPVLRTWLPLTDEVHGFAVFEIGSRLAPIWLVLAAFTAVILYVARRGYEGSPEPLVFVGTLLAVIGAHFAYLSLQMMPPGSAFHKFEEVPRSSAVAFWIGVTAGLVALLGATRAILRGRSGSVIGSCAGASVLLLMCRFHHFILAPEWAQAEQWRSGLELPVVRSSGVLRQTRVRKLSSPVLEVYACDGKDVCFTSDDPELQAQLTQWLEDSREPQTLDTQSVSLVVDRTTLVRDLFPLLRGLELGGVFIVHVQTRVRPWISDGHCTLYLDSRGLEHATNNRLIVDLVDDSLRYRTHTGEFAKIDDAVASLHKPRDGVWVALAPELRWESALNLLYVETDYNVTDFLDVVSVDTWYLELTVE